MGNNKPKIEWSEVSGKKCLKFTFGINITSDEAGTAIEEWRNCFKKTNERPITIIWDCRKMKRYDLKAKDLWTDALIEMKPEIDTIKLITENLIVRLAAKIMGHVTKIPIKTVHSESEIVFPE